MRVLRVVLAIVVAFVGTFVPVAPQASAQGYPVVQVGQSVLVPVTGPSCPSVAGLQTAPDPPPYGVCAYNSSLANVTLSNNASTVIRWRWYETIAISVWPWPNITLIKVERTGFAYPGQSVSTDWFQVYVVVTPQSPSVVVVVPSPPPSLPAPPPSTGCPVFGGIQTSWYWTGSENVCKRWPTFVTSDYVPWGWRADVWLPNEGRTLWNQLGGTWIRDFDEATLRRW